MLDIPQQNPLKYSFSAESVGLVELGLGLNLNPSIGI